MSTILSVGSRLRESGGFSKMASFGRALKDWCLNIGHEVVSVRDVEKTDGVQFATDLVIDLTSPKNSKAREKAIQFDSGMHLMSKQLKQLKQMHLTSAAGLNCILEPDTNAFVPVKADSVKTSNFHAYKDDIEVPDIDKHGFRPIEPVAVSSQMSRPQILKPKPLKPAAYKPEANTLQLQAIVAIKPHAFKPVRVTSPDLEVKSKCNAVSEMVFRPINPVKVSSENLRQKIVRPTPVKVTASEHVIITPKVVKPTLLKPHVFKRVPARSEVKPVSFRPVEPMKASTEHVMPQIIKPQPVKPTALQPGAITAPVNPITLEPLHLKPKSFCNYVRQNN